jgi:hypothetical protein
VPGRRLPARRCVDSRDILHATTTGDPRPTAGASLLAEVAPHCTLIVRIVHDLTWRGWPIGPFVANYIIGELFVKNIATKTLRTIKQHIEGHNVLP